MRISTEKQEYTPPEPSSSLPEVSKETIKGLLGQLNSELGTPDAVEFINSFAKPIEQKLVRENPLLYREIRRFFNDPPYPLAQSPEAAVALFIYEALWRQSMTDKMNDEFGK